MGEGTGERLEVVSIRWGLDTWSREGAGLGGVGGIGVSVMGVSNLQELEETIRGWNSVLDGLPLAGREVPKEKKEWSLARAETVAEKAKAVWTILGRWKNYSMLPPAKPMTSSRPFHAIHFIDGSIMPTGSYTTSTPALPLPVRCFAQSSIAFCGQALSR